VTLIVLTNIPGENDGSEEAVVFDVRDFNGCGDKIKTCLDILVKKNIPVTAINLHKIDIPVPSVTKGQRRLVLQHVDFYLISMSADKCGLITTWPRPVRVRPWIQNGVLPA